MNNSVFNIFKKYFDMRSNHIDSSGIFFIFFTFFLLWLIVKLIKWYPQKQKRIFDEKFFEFVISNHGLSEIEQKLLINIVKEYNINPLYNILINSSVYDDIVNKIIMNNTKIKKRSKINENADTTEKMKVFENIKNKLFN